MTREDIIKIVQAMWKYKDCGYSEYEIREALDGVLKMLEQDPIGKLKKIQAIVNESKFKTVPIYKLKNLVDKLQDEKDYAYANFDEYKLDVLGCEDTDELPNDDYRFGLNRAIALLEVLIAESEAEA